MFGSKNTGSAYDPAGIGFTAIPKFERYTINSLLFFYGSKTNANIGASYITESRIGGSMNYVKNGIVGYFEKNNTGRINTQVDVRHKLSDVLNFHFKSSYSNFNRLITLRTYKSEGVQQILFGTELHYTIG